MQRRRVLICEDEGLTSLRLRTTLTNLGYQVVGQAKDGTEVVPLAAELRPDAILMDIEMPNLDGISATRLIARSSPTAIIIVSAYSDQESVTAAFEAGASGYLVKPVTDAQLEPALRAAVASFARRQSQAVESCADSRGGTAATGQPGG